MIFLSGRKSWGGREKGKKEEKKKKKRTAHIFSGSPPRNMMEPLPKRALMSFITLSTALAWFFVCVNCLRERKGEKRGRG